MQTIFNLSQAEVENLLKDHETEEVSIQVQMSKSENLPSTVTEEPSQFDSQFGESQLGDTSGKFLIAYDRRSLPFRVKGRTWYHSNRLDELIRLHPLDRHKMAPVRRDRRSKVKILENHHWAAQT